MSCILLLLAASACSAAVCNLTKAVSGAHWRVRDVAAGSGYVTADTLGNVPGLNLRLEPVSTDRGSACTVIDTTGTDRAVTLAYCIPIDARGGLWWDNPGKLRRIAGKRLYADLVDNGLGATGYVSRYPLAVVTLGEESFCLALPIDRPRMARLVYDAGRREFRAEFDFGLSKLCKHFPSRADASVITYVVSGFERERKPPNVGARWAFRQAIRHYWDLYPEVFKRRVDKAGTWLPFQSISTIQRPEDFGFVFHEVAQGDSKSPKEDDKLGVGSYVYTEPMTNWREFRGPGPKSYPGHMKEITDDALKGDLSAQATLTSLVKLANGRGFVYLNPVAFTPMSPFGVNCDPDVPTADWPGWPNRAQFENDRLSTLLGWKDAPCVGFDGVYVDSMESGWSLGNYNRGHWAVTCYPLTFDPITKRICLANFWGNYAFIKDLWARLRAKGMWLMGNDAFYRYWFLAPYVDIPGREYSWYENGRFTLLPDERYFFFRTMAGRKPYLMLMNNRFDDGSHMEEYFQRSLFWAVYPSMFHGHASTKEIPYFYNPDWYNRDRELFRKYIPLIRKLDEAGWEPVPWADASPDHIRIERYGRSGDNNLAFALHNPAARPVSVRLTLSRSELGLPGHIAAAEWITDKAPRVESTGGDPTIHLALPANGYAVIGINCR